MTTTNFKIRPANPGDEVSLQTHFLNFLELRDAQQHALLPNLETVDFMWESHFLPAIEENRGVFVAEDAHSLVGSLFWVAEPAPPITLRYRTAYGWGHFVRESHRGQGVYRELMTYARQYLKSRGVHKVLDTVNYHAGSEALEHAERAGFKKSDQVVYLEL